MLALALLCGASGALYAAEGDVAVPLTSESGAPLGEGFYRAGSLWVPADVMKNLGTPLTGGPNGKGFIITVEDPAGVFGDADIARLCGGRLSLYFPSLIEAKVSYFNPDGVEAITGVAASDTGASVVLRRVKTSVTPRQPNAVPAGKLSLAWAHITSTNPDLGSEEKINGLSVLSPTWFNLTDGMGGMANRASAVYTDAAHRKGYSVWGLVSNGFSKTNTTAFFRNNGAKNLFIARILAYAKLYGLDGINLDFENVDPADRDAYVSFVAALSPYLRARGLTFSVDVFIPAKTNSSRSHDRASLAKHADYIMLMAYDEHWRTCKTSGSVASMPWVERAVSGTLAEGVPANRLVLGVPFYMRRWEETPTGGKPKVKSYTLTMASSDNLLRSKGLTPMWLAAAGQNFYSYNENGKTYKIWVEDEQSMAKRMDLATKYGLAGVAGWRKGHETPDIWNVIADWVNK